MTNEHVGERCVCVCVCGGGAIIANSIIATIPYLDAGSVTMIADNYKAGSPWVDYKTRLAVLKPTEHRLTPTVRCRNSETTLHV